MNSNQIYYVDCWFQALTHVGFWVLLKLQMIWWHKYLHTDQTQQTKRQRQPIVCRGQNIWCWLRPDNEFVLLRPLSLLTDKLHCFLTLGVMRSKLWMKDKDWVLYSCSLDPSRCREQDTSYNGPYRLCYRISSTQNYLMMTLLFLIDF